MTAIINSYSRRGLARERTLKVDRRGLVGAGAAPPGTTSVQEETPLTKELQTLIRTLGPLTVADFMGHALQHPQHG